MTMTTDTTHTPTLPPLTMPLEEAMRTQRALRRLKRRTDYAEHGGAPLLGIDGVALICHGGSNAKAMQNAVYVADRFAQLGLGKELTAALARHAGLWDAPAAPAAAVEAMP